MQAMALKLVVIEDPEGMKRIRPLLRKRSPAGAKRDLSDQPHAVR
jgi:hypothetical protein